MRKMKLADFSYEEKLWRQGIEAVIGVDEVGRGALSGPVVAGAAMLKFKIQNSNDKSNSKFKKILRLGIDDSKRLKSRERVRLVSEIRKYFFTAIGEATVEEINTLGIVGATGRAMRRAIKNFQLLNNFFLLIDGYVVRNLPGGKKRQMGIIKGDRKSVSIAAASIVAKVYRDRLMRRLSRQFPVYKWGLNKGYGTLVHRRALELNGKCQHHRLLYVDGII